MWRLVLIWNLQICPSNACSLWQILKIWLIWSFTAIHVPGCFVWRFKTFWDPVKLAENAASNVHLSMQIPRKLSTFYNVFFFLFWPLTFNTSYVKPKLVNAMKTSLSSDVGQLWWTAVMQPGNMLTTVQSGYWGGGFSELLRNPANKGRRPWNETQPQTTSSSANGLELTTHSIRPHQTLFGPSTMM